MNNFVTFYYQPNSLRKSEANFFNALTDCYPNSRTLNAHFLVPENTVDQYVAAGNLIHWLEMETLLPPKKKQECLNILQNCPPQLRIALHPKEISFDVVAVVEEKCFYWEFHEKQHVRLSNDRPKYVYSAEGNRIEVPRYFQRLVRDVWRALYFRPYTVIWQDWFETAVNQTVALEMRDGYREFYKGGKFSFEKFLSQ